MKLLKKYKYWLAVLLLSAGVVGCMFIEEIIHPDDAKVNETIDITVKIKLVPETDDNSRLVFAILAPKSWNIASTADVKFSTTGYTKGAGDVTNEKMTLMSDNELEFSTSSKWSTAFQSKIGLMGNLGPVEWVVFESSTSFVTEDPKKGGDPEIKATVNIKLKTGSQAIKVFMGYVFCGKHYGFGNDRYEDNALSKVLTVTGGSLPMLDYTTVTLVSTVPSTFGYGDIFSVLFEEKVGSIETALLGADKVYLYGKVIYNNGLEKTVDVINSKTLMEKIGETTWQKYIYPKEFFGLPADAVITKTYFHFSNEAKTIIVKDDEEDDDFLIMESPE